MNFRRIMAETRTGLSRNMSMVVSIVLVTFISLTFVGAAVLLQMQISSMKTFWYDKAQVAIYLCSDSSSADQCPNGAVTDDERQAIEERLDSDLYSQYVDQYYYEDQQQAYENFKEQFADNQALSFVTQDQLWSTYWVNLQDPNDAAQAAVIIDGFTGMAGVDQVQDQKAYLDQIFAVLNVGSLTALSIAGLMLVAAILLITTTIRLSAFSRRRELGIMRLVGASNFFIQTPFVLEGVVSAFIGSVLASAALAAVVKFFVQGYLQSAMPYTAFISLHSVWPVFPIVIGVGVVLSALASAFAIRRYLRV
ncbi:permease-like cell division protein FtsX [Pseudoclavibacter caeni]|jgi:cell division transport system permease protein|uniref:Cell division protein FtsX n=1 Tax=Pseudoclavibacter caeni TaxID=908846 RepID=A0A7C8BRK9_9MICO|nr:permease-like cell division protein FtsX [Pseudoclavibacter caeni]KAB1631967.1 ABC transporter permease [Pseudoclavibacter caeni]NYJ96830.1 cell division transport system permease protein [Pseudoclavibacter caeni]